MTATKKKPFGNRAPEGSEIPTPFELSILDGILTDDQKEVWRAGIQEPAGTGILTEVEEIQLRVRELNKEGLALPLIFDQIQKDFNNSFDLSQIAEMIK